MPDTYRRPLLDSHQIAEVLKQFNSALKADGLAPVDCTGVTEAFIANLFAEELKKLIQNLTRNHSSETYKNNFRNPTFSL